MMLLPTASALPLTVSVAPDAVSGTLPKVVLPSENVTLPAATPLAALTVAASCVDPVDAMVEGLAVSDMVVATGGIVTATVVVPDELLKFPVAV